MNLLSFLSFLTINNPICNFYLDDLDYYKCDVVDFYNPTGFDGFTAIDGEHISGYQDFNVQIMTFYSERTLNVPHVICEKFSNLRELFMEFLNIEIIEETTFQKCTSIDYINLWNNPILTLHPDTFSRNIYLNALLLTYTRLTSVPENLLQQNRQLEFLVIANNIDLVDIPAGFFQPCKKWIKYVYMDANKLSVWHSDWFTNATALLEIQAFENLFTSIPNNAIDGSQLNTLNLERNFLTDLSSSSFKSVANLENLGISYNDLTGIDRQLFEQAQNLQTVNARRSNCVDRDFFDFSVNRITNMNLLSTCFDGYGVVGEFTTVGSESRFFPFRGDGIVVEVKVANHAVIMLSETQNANAPYVEIRIDENNNDESYFSRILVDGAAVGDAHIAKYLNANEFTTFIIQWNFSLISVERILAGSYDGPFLTYGGSIDWTKIKYFGVKTTGDHVATWRIQIASESMLNKI